MRKVFLSFLGTTDYHACIYEARDKHLSSPPVRFVQEATMRFFCSNWTRSDRIFIFATEEAEKKNWLDNGHSDPNANEIKKRDGLKTRLGSLPVQAEIYMVRIPEGKSEEEIWEIFHTVYGSLEEGDGVIFDITHAFRSIPMLALVVLNYAKALKNIKVQGIYYGAMETLGGYRVVANTPKHERRVPIFDLTPFAELLDWTAAIQQFIQAGDAGAIERLTQQAVQAIKKEKPEMRTDAQALKTLSEHLNNFCGNLATCRGPSISASAKSLKLAVDNCANPRMVKALFPLFERLSDRIKDFSDDPFRDGLKAARWCADHNLIQQGYTILQESIFSYLITAAGLDCMDLKTREICSSAAKIVRESLPPEKWLGGASSNKDITFKLIDEVTRTGAAKLLANLTMARNDLNHAGFNASPRSPKKFKKGLLCFINEAEKLLQDGVQGPAGTTSAC